jgi:C-terminal processing protease CtpA/Prc
LFSSNFDYTISLANFNNGNPIATGGTVDLMRSQVQENPVAITRVFVEGSQRIGYLLYNQFASSFDAILNDAFANLQGAGITDLIVDLRYNPGGSVRTATYLGGMITGQFAGQLFSKEVWNSKVQANVNTNSFNNLFTNQINNGLVTQNINSLNLTRVYFIVTGGSASASELLINSLKSYIDVKLVGTTTEGKNVGSVTLYDSPNFSRNGANPNHTWAMQPIVLEIQNKDGVTSPDGFTPEIAMPEDYGNLGVLGDRNEPLLDRTITYILTGMRSSRITTVPQLEEVTNSKLFTPTRDNMYVDLKKE